MFIWLHANPAVLLQDLKTTDFGEDLDSRGDTVLISELHEDIVL